MQQKPPNQNYEIVTTAQIGYLERAKDYIRSRARQLGAAALAGMLLAPAVNVSGDEMQPANADAVYEYTIERTNGEGVWLHQDPGLGDENDLIKTMKDGTKFKAKCYVIDTPIGDRNNPVWLYGTDEEGNRGYFTDFYSSSRWSSADKSGLPPLCGQESNNNDPHKKPEEQKIQSHTVFYAPGNGDTVWYEGKQVSMPVPDGVYVMATEGDKHPKWTDSSHECGTENADNFGDEKQKITTLGGWSIGRLGPPYYLENSSPQERDAINYILLIDPGSKQDYQKNNCDQRYDQSALYAEWLGEDSNNRLAVLAGELTEDKDNPTYFNHHPYAHAGIQTLFDNIRGTRLAKQVVVCNYPGIDHVTMYKDYRTMLTKSPIADTSNCPAAPNSGTATGWRP